MAHRVALSGTEQSFTVEAGESILDAARRAGLALPYSCLGGRCGSCKAVLLSGDCHYPRQPPTGLTREEREHRQILLCQAEPLNDLMIVAREVASVGDFPRRVMALKLVDKHLVAPDVMSLRLRPPRGDRLRYLPGQYLDVLLPEGKRRSFSIANAPEDADHIDLHIRHVTGGGFTEWVFRELQVGAILRVEGPLGTFVPREHSERPMLFVAGGTGFAPIKAIIEHFLHLGSTRPMHLYWGVRDEGELYLPDLPARWAAEHPALYFTAVLSAPRAGEDTRHRTGLVHQAVLADFPALNEFDVYMSGPPALIDAGRRAFVQAGLPEDRLYYDSFEYAPDVLAAILSARAGISHEN